MVKAKVIEIRWHDTTPIFSCDFHAISPEQHRKSAHGYINSSIGTVGLSSAVSPVSTAKDSKTMPSQHEQNAEASPSTQSDAVPSTSAFPTAAVTGTDKEEMWRLATCGGDKHVRLWLVRPHPLPPPVPISLVPLTSSKSTNAVGPTSVEMEPHVEYLATLRRHTGVVNVVRFNPAGEMLASASDGELDQGKVASRPSSRADEPSCYCFVDGNIIFWVPGAPSKSLGDSEEDTMFDREQWRPQNMCRTRSGQELYDLSFSPNGAHVVVGSIDHTAMIYDIATGQLIHTIVAHSGFVQGVAWDPYNHYIATQSSDRSMHVYSVAKAEGGLSVHPVGKNTRIELQQRSSGGKWEVSSASSSIPSNSEKDAKSMAASSRGREEPSPAQVTDDEFVRPPLHLRSHSHAGSDRSESSSTTTASRSRLTLAGTDASSATPYPFDDDEPSTPMDPPHLPRPTSRRSSTSGSHHSPALLPASSTTLPVRSPSPAPLPAVRVPLSPTISSPLPSAGFIPAGSNPLTIEDATIGSTPRTSEMAKLYSDSNATFYFRRLAWSPDGSLLLTPAGIFEDPYAVVSDIKTKEIGKKGASTPASASKKRAGEKDAGQINSSGPKPTVYIYSRANLARPPVAHLPGHRSTSIAIRFCPVLWKLRNVGRRGKGLDDDQEEEDETECIDLTVKPGEPVSFPLYGKVKADENETDDDIIIIDDDKPTKSVPLSEGKGKSKADPTALENDQETPQSLFDLPYRMIYAVATLDCVYLYDTQQAGPIAMFANLHYAPFTDLTWSTDGKTLVFSAEDGYCTVIAFEKGELGTPYDRKLEELPEPAAAQLVRASIPTAQSPAPAQAQTTPVAATLPALFASPKLSKSGQVASATNATTNTNEKREIDGTSVEKGEEQPPAKKKKKAVLTHHGPLGSGS